MELFQPSARLVPAIDAGVAVAHAVQIYVGAEALGWNATGLGAFYDDDVHRYLGFLEEEETRAGASLHAAEQEALVTLGSPSSRSVARERREPAPVISESGEEHLSGLRQLREDKEEVAHCRDPRTLPRQVIYHFAIGRAIPDQRLEADCSARKGTKKNPPLPRQAGTEKPSGL
jgi:hypothetical protein